MPGHQYLSGVEEVGQGADRLGVGHRGIGPVVLVEADRLDAECDEGRLARLLEVGGVAVDGPAAVARPPVPSLGGDQHVIGGAAVGRQRLGDEPLSVAVLLGVQRVGVRRVDDGDTGVE